MSVLTNRSDMDHTVLPANYAMPAFCSLNYFVQRLTYHKITYVKMFARFKNNTRIILTLELCLACEKRTLGFCFGPHLE